MLFALPLGKALSCQHRRGRLSCGLLIEFHLPGEQPRQQQVARAAEVLDRVGEPPDLFSHRLGYLCPSHLDFFAGKQELKSLEVFENDARNGCARDIVLQFALVLRLTESLYFTFDSFDILNKK